MDSAIVVDIQVGDDLVCYQCGTLVCSCVVRQEAKDGSTEQAPVPAEELQINRTTGKVRLNVTEGSVAIGNYNQAMTETPGYGNVGGAMGSPVGKKPPPQNHQLLRRMPANGVGPSHNLDDWQCAGCEQTRIQAYGFCPSCGRFTFPLPP